MTVGVFVPVPHAMQLVVEWGTASVNWTNGLWFTKTSFTEGDLQTAAEALNATLVTGILQSMTTAWYLRKVTAIDMRSQGAPAYVHLNGTNAGAVTGPEAPIANCVVATLRTAMRGRAYRGRLYLAGFDQDDLNSLQFNNSQLISDLEGGLLDILDDMATAGFTWVVAHRYEGSTPMTTGSTQAVIAAEIRNNYIGSQRRRTRRP